MNRESMIEQAESAMLGHYYHGDAYECECQSNLPDSEAVAMDQHEHRHHLLGLILDAVLPQVTREEIIALITAAAIAELHWHWDKVPTVPSPEETFRRTAEAIYEALKPHLGVGP